MMKNLMLTMAIVVAGMANAKINPAKKAETTSIKKELKVFKNSKSQKNFKASVKLLKRQVWIAETSCGMIATTTQDWTPAQANAWLEALESNYCK
ncbi:hypothetical protein [Chryseobacterium taichungense]|nr:hypothetical protein [Chryseobacterium taichungense]